jgi:hypothetical protein
MLRSVLSLSANLASSRISSMKKQRIGKASLANQKLAYILHHISTTMKVARQRNVEVLKVQKELGIFVFL